MSASSSVVNPFVFMKSLKNPLAVVVKERHPPLVNPNRQLNYSPERAEGATLASVLHSNREQLQNVSYGPGAVLSASRISTHLFLSMLCGGAIMITFILQMGKQAQRD